MCGIAGIYTYRNAANPVDRGELRLIRDHMARRGPDGAGEWYSESERVGFGHRRLSIIDLSDRAAQPMLSEDGKLVITFNGEIYNYPELKRELEQLGARFRTTSDTEVLLQLYARHGAKMVQRLRGMFAFAIWDQERGRLFLARDPYGIKPLYTSNNGWTFRFASQVKALLAGAQVSRDPEPAGVVGFHLFGSVPDPFTLYREIRALPAGHTQWIDVSGPREPEPFINLAAELADSAQPPQRSTQLIELVRAGVLDSVRAHLVSDVEVGLFLSAGVDSGALLGLMRDAGQRDIRAITLAFDEFENTEEDEAPLAARVAHWYGARHVVRRVSEREFLDDLPAILEAMDQPSIDGINIWFISKVAREAGLKVALSGLGGDELLGGYPSFRDLPRWTRQFGLFASVPSIGRLARVLLRVAVPGLVATRPKALGFLEHAGSWPGAYLLRRGLFLPHELCEIVGPDVAREGFYRLNPMHRLAASIMPDPGSDMARVCALESCHYMKNQLLRDADWAGMAHGLEIRVPLVDATLLRSVAPAIHGLKQTEGKIALARSPSKPLPDEIVKRPKTGFFVPTGAWMEAAIRKRHLGAKRPEAKGLISRAWAPVVFNNRFAAL